MSDNNIATAQNSYNAPGTRLIPHTRSTLDSMQRLKSKMTKHTRLGARRGGFTLLELLVVIGIAGVVMTMAIPRLHAARAARTARNARDVYAWTAQRARVRAIQTGQAQLFEINPATNRAWIVRKGGSTASDTILKINFQTQYDASVSSSGTATITTCYGPRGFAFGRGSSCAASLSADTLTFTHSTYTSRAVMKPLGQVQKL